MAQICLIPEIANLEALLLLQLARAWFFSGRITAAQLGS